ncbi:cationic amino acid transporter 4-like [Gigantopelta aegis]|uniref:cationic amino acid transporter 4-like n=1 Tax=Gigantopelta aegis TaxID=1735272 RepID=UPI001B8877ED|nr:cationic amino acid transporter 4-like [Gigantopelta aegis]
MRRLAPLLSKLKTRALQKKTIHQDDHATDLRRSLTTCQLTFIGVGSTVGVGIYLLAGVAAKEYAGPGVLVSFVLAGVVTMVNAVCYAEFGARVPKTGALYTYVYESACEFLAFQVAWIKIIITLTGGAITARAWSGYVDSLFDNIIQNKTTQYLGKVTLGEPFSEKLDFLAFSFELIVIGVISLWVHTSATLTTILAVVISSVLVFVTSMGFVYGDFANIANVDHGGFLPFGFAGVLAGTSACFYAYSGFDTICMSAEEAKTPSKSVPRAIFLEMVLVTLLYAGTACALIMLVPYWKINTTAPIPMAFDSRGIHWATYIVSIGPVLGFSNLVMVNLFNLSRQIYVLAADGLFFSPFLYINKRTKVPLLAVVTLGSIVALNALLFEIKHLVSFNIIGMLLGNMVTGCIVILKRCEERESLTTLSSDDVDDLQERITEEHTSLDSGDRIGLFFEAEHNGDLLALRKPKGSRLESLTNTLTIPGMCIILVVTCFGLALQVVKGYDDVARGSWLALTTMAVTSCLIIFITILLKMKCHEAQHTGFKVGF